MALAPISGVKDGKLLVQMMTHIVPQVKNRTSCNPPATAPLGYRCTPQPSLGSWGRGLFLEATSRVTSFRIPTVDLRTLPWNWAKRTPSLRCFGAEQTCCSSVAAISGFWVDSKNCNGRAAGKVNAAKAAYTSGSVDWFNIPNLTSDHKLD